MNVIVHYPNDKHDHDTLTELVAELHSAYIYSYLKNLDIPVKKKIEILDGISRDKN